MIANQNKILPGLIPPYKDELLSSWIYRLAIEHKIKPQSFTSYYLNNSHFWTRDVDKFLPVEILKNISKITGLNIEKISELQLNSFSNKLFENKLLTSYTVGLTNLGIYHRNRKLYGLLACPSCLEKKQYFKKQWRLLTSIVCTECRCHLIDKCTNCQAPIIFHRLDIGNKNKFNEKPFYLCWNCNYDYRKQIRNIENNQLFKYQIYINNLLINGYNETYQYSFLYFKILLLFFCKINTQSLKWNRIKDGFINECKLVPNQHYKTNMIYLTSLDFRSNSLPYLYELLNDIEHNFIPFCKKNKIRYSDFNKDDKHLPFWFYEIFMKYY